MALYNLIFVLGLFYIVDAASFFGASYISLPFQEAKQTTEISFRIKTYRPDSLILLAAGQTDYCLVVLEGGALKTRINLGAGEFELSSTPRLRLDDLLWHNVHIISRSNEVSLIVDHIHVTSKKLTGKFRELNIHHGIFVGGMGDFTDLFLGILDNFRGCLEQVIYNGVDIYKKARQGSAYVYGVDWKCSDEFDAAVDSTISFDKPDSYMAFEQPFSRSGGSIQFEIKTQVSNALLMYNSGPPSKSDFIAMEVVDKRVRLVIDKGKGPTNLNTSLLVSDGKWHHIAVTFSPTEIDIFLDNLSESKSMANAENKYLDLSSYLYIGGVEVNKKSRAVLQGAINADKSLKGCLRNLRVNTRPLGIRDPRVTMGLSVGCKWFYQCDQVPCIKGASCVEENIDGFRCLCNQTNCVRSDFMADLKQRPHISVDQQILNISPLEVAEGSQVIINTNYLRTSIEYEKYGIRESGIIFHVVEPPKYGRLIVDIWTRETDEAFTMLDVAQDRVTYSHDGSETTKDAIQIELKFVAQSGYILPSHLQSKHRFLIPVKINPVNDPPVVHLPTGRSLRLPKDTKVQLTNYYLNSTDSDSPSRSLRYNILTLRDGMVESLRQPDKPAFSFSQEDVDKGIIYYKHSGNSETQLIFKVSDGIKESQNEILKIVAYNIQVHLVNNTGLKLAHGTWSLISSSNLSCSTNSERGSLEVSYKIISSPKYGELQVFKNGRTWQSVSHVHHSTITRKKLRYEHTTGKPEVDEFRFRILVGDIEFPTDYTFRVSFVTLTVHIMKNSPLLIDSISESFISESFLRTGTKPSQASPSDIVYTLVSTPHYGSVFLSSRDLTSQSRLRPSSNFTQEDIAKGRLKYKLHHKTFSQFHDAFEFFVSSKGRTTDIRIFNIRYKPPALDAPLLINDMQISEGGKERISEKYIRAERGKLNGLIFNVTSPPKNGFLVIAGGSRKYQHSKSVDQFTSNDIHSGFLYYEHDDSETVSDSFSFVAFSKDPSLDFQFVGEMLVHIILKNDNPPLRVNEKVLNVVTNGERIITSKDLTYIDPDNATPVNKIEYSVSKLVTGAFYNLERRENPIHSFTQQDINNKKIIYQHHGSIYSKVHITVSDGQLISSGVLEVVASDPFVEVLNNTGIFAPQLGNNIITTHNLSIETNLNAWGKSILYEILEAPQHGNLVVHGIKMATHFTEYDLDGFAVKYQHTSKDLSKDQFSFRASVGDTYIESQFEIQMYPPSYWEPLLTVSNSTLIVEEGSETMLSQSLLHIMHPDIPPSNIVYHIVKQPQYGVLELDVETDNYDDGKAYEYDLFGTDYGDYFYIAEELAFSQAMIDEGRIKYIHTSANLTEDHFVYDVTNGITNRKGLFFNIEVIPKTVYVSAGALQVVEGNVSALSPSLITVLSPYYRDRLNTLLITDPPLHGRVERSTEHGRPLKSFTPVDMENGLIQYVHDGSETDRDSFSLVAISGTRRSAPVKVVVTIKRHNDEIPKVIRNEELHVWEGENIPITNEVLAIFDDDTLPQYIKYHVSPPKCGFLSLVSNIGVPILNFTQEQIDEMKVYFTHIGPLQCKIEWEASDGIHRTGLQYTLVSAEPLHLEVTNFNPLYLFPLMKAPLLTKNLLVSTNAADIRRPVFYTIKKPPTLGRVLYEDIMGNLILTTNFTQNDINESRIYYQHIKALHDLSAEDSFTLDIQASLAEPLLNQVFNVHITVGGKRVGQLSKYLQLEKLSVHEGGSATLSPSNLNLSSVSEFLLDYTGTRHSENLIAKVISLPMHGQITYYGKPLSDDMIFRTVDIEQGAITYTHDDSDTTNDSFMISVYLLGTSFSASDILLHDGKINISISPVNDQVFRLVTRNPHLSVVRGQNSVISRKNLLTLDADNSPNEIVYEVMTDPNFGKIVRKDNVTIPIMLFTQEDINKEEVIFIQDGSNVSAEFYFQVSDGAHEPKYTVFTVNVVPLEIKLENHSIITLEQTLTLAQITSSNLGVKTNGDPSLLLYTLSKEPRYGSLLLDNTPTTHFSQLNIDEKKLFYHQENLLTSWDSFSLKLHTKDEPLKSIDVKIMVTPLLESKPLQATVGIKTKLKLKHLNATLLAERTNSIPHYHIVKSPRLGHIKKITRRTKRGSRAVQVKQFSHEDIKKGRVYYAARKLHLKPGEELQDTLHYILKAPTHGVQPGQGTLSIHVEAGPDKTVTEGRRLRPGRPSKKNTAASPSRPHPEIVEVGSNQNYIILISLLILLILVVVSTCVVLKCISRRKAPKTDNHVRQTAPNNSMDIDVASLPPPGSTGSRPNSFTTEEFAEIEGHHVEMDTTSPCQQMLHNRSTDPSNTFSAPESEGSWHKDSSREFSPSVPQCTVTALSPEDSCHSSCQSPCPPPASIAGYPYGADPEQLEEWGVYETQPLRSNNPMLRKNQYWV